MKLCQCCLVSWFILLFIFSVSSFGDDVSETVLLESEPANAILPKLRRSETKFLGQLIYSPFDLMIPSKYGFSLGWHENVNNTWEAEYVRGSLSIPIIIADLGHMTDQRISIIRRSFFSTKSFNLSYGITYFDFSAQLGSEYLSNVSGGAAPSVQEVGVRSLGFNLGLGNKWVIAKDFTVGIDWVSLSQPLVTLEQKSSYLDWVNSEDAHSKVDDAIRLTSYFPRFSLLKIQAGFLF